MVLEIKKARLDNIESQIITGIIVSDDFVKKVRAKLKPAHLKTIHGEVLIKWCFKYFDDYGKAPKQDIQRVYKENKNRLRNKKHAKLVGVYLDKLSNDYERQSKYNAEYLYDKTLDYIRKRDLENLVEQVHLEVERDKIDNASKKLIDFQLIHKETSKVFNPLDPKYIEGNYEDGISGILMLPDALGQLIGPLDRGWLVSFTAPEKRGKTWWLIEMAFQALMQKLNVLFISLEMPEKDIRRRMWIRATAGSRKSKIIIPVLDCRLNQFDECDEFDIRENEYQLYSKDENKPLYREVRGKYKPCFDLRCKDKVTDFWYERIKVSEYGRNLLLTKAESIEEQVGDSLRVKCYPAYTANLQDIKSLIDELEVNEGFIPDVLIVDYLDILATMPGMRDGRENIDATWKMAKSLAASKSLLHITVDQSSKITYDKDIRLYDTSEDKRKNAHLDVKVAMNAVPERLEEDVNVLRFTVIAHRHMSFNVSKEVLVLQQTSIGQPLLDCALYKRRETKNVKRNKEI